MVSLVDTLVLPGTKLVRARYGSLLAEKQALWAPLYAATLDILGTAALLVPMGDDNHQNGARTTVTTVGEEQVVFTYTKAVDAFDSPPTFEGPAGIPVINFNQSDEWLETPDAAFWNDSAGSSEPSYYWSCWVNIIAGTSTNMLWTKTPNPGTAGTDWVMFITTAERVVMRIIDDSAAAYIGQLASNALPSAWHHIAVTKHDDSALSSSILLYVDGLLIVDSDDESGTYVAQEDGTTVVRIGAESDGGAPNGNPLAGGPLGPCFIPVGTGAVPTPDAILRLYQLGRAALGV